MFAHSLHLFANCVCFRCLLHVSLLLCCVDVGLPAFLFFILFYVFVVVCLFVVCVFVTLVLIGSSSV